jgi:hypothetical protein
MGAFLTTTQALAGSKTDGSTPSPASSSLLIFMFYNWFDQSSCPSGALFLFYINLPETLK